MQHDEEWQEREYGMERGRVESVKPPTQALRPAVDGSVLTSVFVRRTQGQYGLVQGFFLGARQWSSF